MRQLHVSSYVYSATNLGNNGLYLWLNACCSTVCPRASGWK